MKWKVFFASATGKYHLACNVPCQDSGHYEVIEDVLIGVVCDGAGSAREGQAGSEFFARKVTELVSESIRSGHFVEDTQSDYRDYLLAIIRTTRSELDEIAFSRQMEPKEFACTLVGCIASRNGGCFFHIGDGFAIHLRESGESVLSNPENGEYAEETYFVTDNNWEDHLRVTPVSVINRGCLIGLMTDGASPFAVNRLRTGFYRPFIDPVVAYLRNATEDNGNLALRNLLESEKTSEITPDDKTLLLALAS
jgi:Protein phosphatase 2C